MISEEMTLEYYQALIGKNSEYEGIFYVGVKTTGIFCRPTRLRPPIIDRKVAQLIR